jgi:GxxExxY protein
MNENQLAREIVDAAYQIHSKLGPGLFESVYEVVLSHELEKRGLVVERQKTIPIRYDKFEFDEGFRADIVVENSVIIELKSVETISPVHKKQLLTYLRLADMRLGLLINFGAVLIKNGISRVVNGLEE